MGVISLFNLIVGGNISVGIVKECVNALFFLLDGGKGFEQLLCPWKVGRGVGGEELFARLKDFTPILFEFFKGGKFANIRMC